MNIYMKEAIDEARKGINNQEGGPFGCIIVKGENIVGRGHNQVVLRKDPTCHGEMQAIRNACKNLDTFDLSDCTLYTTGEPCPMCLAACMWANIDKIYYGCTVAENAEIGFRDEAFFERLANAEDFKKTYLERMEKEACKELFEEYKLKDKTAY